MVTVTSLHHTVPLFLKIDSLHNAWGKYIMSSCTCRQSDGAELDPVEVAPDLPLLHHGISHPLTELGVSCGTQKQHRITQWKKKKYRPRNDMYINLYN